PEIERKAAMAESRVGIGKCRPRWKGDDVQLTITREGSKCRIGERNFRGLRDLFGGEGRLDAAALFDGHDLARPEGYNGYDQYVPVIVVHAHLAQAPSRLGVAAWLLLPHVHAHHPIAGPGQEFGDLRVFEHRVDDTCFYFPDQLA